MIASILNSTKKSLGLAENYDVFDHDVITHINSAFATLHQLGIGPITGYMIEGDEETWDDFLHGDKRFSSIKQYVYLKVRVVFDPHLTSHVHASMNEQIRELEWRLNVLREGGVFGVVGPTFPADESDVSIIDNGDGSWTMTDGDAGPGPVVGVFDGGTP